MHVAVVGATGAVGRTMLEVLESRNLPVEKISLFASPKSAGTRIRWKGKSVTVRELKRGSFRGVDVALFSAGGERSREWAPRAAEEGAIVIDNSSAWRMDDEVPLVVPDVNPDAVKDRPRGIIANPNCSTIQMVVALNPIRVAAGLRSIVVTTFQSVSGAGEVGRETLRNEQAGELVIDSPFKRPIHGDVLPQIGEFDEDGWTEEERKMIYEPRKIFDLPELQVAPTCVRVPVDVGHAIQMAVETVREMPRSEVRYELSGTDGIIYLDEHSRYPSPKDIVGWDAVFVGRVRTDLHRPRVLHLWAVADNLRRGAATNAVMIAELLQDG